MNGVNNSSLPAAGGDGEGSSRVQDEEEKVCEGVSVGVWAGVAARGHRPRPHAPHPRLRTPHRPSPPPHSGTSSAHLLFYVQLPPVVLSVVLLLSVTVPSTVSYCALCCPLLSPLLSVTVLKSDVALFPAYCCILY